MFTQQTRGTCMQVHYRMVKGLTFEMCQKGKMSQEVHIEFVQAVKDLEEKKVCAITGDCAPPPL